MVSVSGNIWIVIKPKILTYQKPREKVTDVLQFTCCCACNGTFQQVTVKGYGNWTSAKGRYFMPFSNCAPLLWVTSVLTFHLFIFILTYYNVSCHKIYTNQSIQHVKFISPFSNTLLKLTLLPGTHIAHCCQEAPVQIIVVILSIIS